MHIDSEAPKITVVTPSYNQAEFLEDAIQSVLIQNYPALEYIVIDGESNDGSLEILEKYKCSLHYWCSESDNGQYDAINKGFQNGTGDIMSWLNSDDMYTPWVFNLVSRVFCDLPEVEWLTTLSPLVWDASGAAISCPHRGGYTRKGFLRGENLPEHRWFGLGTIQQESVFWRRSLWERAGGYLDTTYPLAADFELWARFYQHAELYTVGVPLGGFRSHGNQKSVLHAQQYTKEAVTILTRYGGHPRNQLQGIFKKILKDYVRLPQSFRALAVKLRLKASHYHCVYSTIHNHWCVNKI